MSRTARVLTLLALLGPVPEAVGAADLGPCSAFTDYATYVSSTLIMQLEHRRVGGDGSDAQPSPPSNSLFCMTMMMV